MSNTKQHMVLNDILNLKSQNIQPTHLSHEFDKTHHKIIFEFLHFK